MALRAYAAGRGWQVVEYVDRGVSGAKEHRPALDALLSAAGSRKLDVVACVRLDRLARSTHHLLTLAKELEALGVDLGALTPLRRRAGSCSPCSAPSRSSSGI